MRMKFLWNLEIPIIFSDKNSRSNRIKKAYKNTVGEEEKKKKKFANKCEISRLDWLDR